MAEEAAMFLSQFQTVGRDLFTQGLVSSLSGNLSIRLGDRLIITRRGCQVGDLAEQDLIETGINKNGRFTPYYDPWSWQLCHWAATGGSLWLHHYFGGKRSHPLLAEILGTGFPE